MINAWSLAAEVLAGTLDETYPIIKNEKKNQSKGSSQTRKRSKDECDSNE